jgi:hypothetical protein
VAAVGTGRAGGLGVELLQHLNREDEVVGFEQGFGNFPLRRFVRHAAGGVEEDVGVDEPQRHFRPRS